MHREHRADRYPLLLARRQGEQRPVAKVEQAKQVKGFLDPAAHHLGGDAE